jgi:hypothetical protein
MTDLLQRISELIRISDRVLSYDNSIIATIPYILYEDQGISPFSTLGEHDSLNSLQNYFSASTTIRDLPRLINIDQGINEFAMESINLDQDHRFDSWSTARILNATGNSQDQANVLKLQSNLGKGRYNSRSELYPDKLEVDVDKYLYCVSTEPSRSLGSKVIRKLFPALGSARSWERLIHSLINSNKLDRCYPSLSIGPDGLRKFSILGVSFACQCILAWTLTATQMA